MENSVDVLKPVKWWQHRIDIVSNYSDDEINSLRESIVVSVGLFRNPPDHLTYNDKFLKMITREYWILNLLTLPFKCLPLNLQPVDTSINKNWYSTSSLGDLR